MLMFGIGAGAVIFGYLGLAYWQGLRPFRVRKAVVVAPVAPVVTTPQPPSPSHEGL